MNETKDKADGDNQSILHVKPKRKSIMVKKEKEEIQPKLNIKSKRKSMMKKKVLIDLEENKTTSKNTKDSMMAIARKKTMCQNSKSNLQVDLNDNLNNDKNKRRKSAMVRPSLELKNYDKLIEQLIDVKELIIKQESNVVEALLGCEQPNNYHIYARQPNGELSYIYKCREFSGCAMRVLCPVNCRGFSMKMKLVSSNQNNIKDDNFNNSLININKNCGCPFLCLVRPEMTVNLIKDETYLGAVEQTFSFCDPCFTIYNEKEEKVKYIEADCCQCGYICRNNSIGKTDNCHFFVYNPQDKTKPIGDICKKTESVFSVSDSYSVSYPVDIPPEEKILLSVVAMLIDYQYYEKNTIK